MKLIKFKNALTYTFYITFAITFTYLFVCTFIYKVSYSYSLNMFICFIIGIFILLLWYFIYKVINKFYDRLSSKQQFLLLLFTFIFFCFLILTILIWLKLTPDWDYRIIYEQAKSYALYGDRTHTTTSPSYFQYYNNNIGLFLILAGVFKVCSFIGIKDFLTVATILNALLVGFSIFLLYLCIKKLSNKKSAFFSLIVSLFFIPLFTYIPMFYTDTFSLPFVMLLFYLYLSIDSKKLLSKKNIILFASILFVAFLGSKIKMTVLVVFIACFIHFMFTSKLKYTLLLLLIITAFFSFSSVLWEKLVYENKSFSFIQNEYGHVPSSHFLMMGVQRKDDDLAGINCLGCYNHDDFNQTLFYKNSKEGAKADIKEYITRVREYGFSGYFIYLSKKAVNAWGEGSYFSNVVYKLNLAENNIAKKLIIGEDNKIILYFQQGVSEAMLLIFGCYSFIMFFKRKKMDTSTIILISIYGMFVLLLFWENRSRYLYNYIPIFITLITLFYYNINKFKLKK